MIPAITVGIDYEPIHWVLKSHVLTGDEHKYEFCAPSQFEGRSYYAMAIESPSREAHFFEIVF